MSAQTPQRAQKPQLRGQRQQQTTVSMWLFRDIQMRWREIVSLQTVASHFVGFQIEASQAVAYQSGAHQTTV